MALYDFFVGSTDTHDAHRDTVPVGRVIDRVSPGVRLPQCIYGVWNSDIENVAQYTVELSDDATAQRIAYALTVLTGNDCVLISRLTVAADDERSMGGTRAYRVTKEGRISGDRTLYGPPLEWLNGDDLGTVLTPDVRGDYVAYLVWQDASVSAVN